MVRSWPPTGGNSGQGEKNEQVYAKNPDRAGLRAGSSIYDYRGYRMSRIIKLVQCDEFSRDMDTAFSIAGYVMCALVTIVIAGGAL